MPPVICVSFLVTILFFYFHKNDQKGFLDASIFNYSSSYSPLMSLSNYNNVPILCFYSTFNMFNSPVLSE